MNILLAEDDTEIRSLLAEILEDYGHNCVQAPDGKFAKDILEAGHRFDLLVTDFRMPHMNGAQLFTWCRDHGLSIPVIFISANTELMQPEKVVLQDDKAIFLPKPIGIDQLISAVNASVKN